MKTVGMGHQLIGLDRCAGKRNFAFLMEQGTGKTWLTMADAERLFQKGLINALLVFAPNGVHTNWVKREIPTHMSIETVCTAWRGTPGTKKAKDAIERLYRTHYEEGKAPMRVFTINIEAINSANGYEAVKRFLIAYKVLAVVDESTRIKNPTAKRSEKAVKLGELAVARRILSGTPLTKAPTDLFMQYQFLKDGILGTDSFRAFNSEFAVLLKPDDPAMIAIMRKLAGKTKGMPQVVAKDECGDPMYRNLEKLANLIAPHSYRVTKKEALPFLPPKVYKVRNFELTPNQRKIYEQVQQEYSYVIERENFTEDVSFEAIAARTKLKQITSGFINIYGDPILLPPEDNPRMLAFQDEIESLMELGDDKQFIIWAMYEQELLQIKKFLDSIGETSDLYYGKTSGSERERIIDEFQGGKIRWFIGHTAAAGIGLTLTAAETALYYSCSPDNEHRMQSEDRCHRIGTVNSVLYIDFIGEDTIDEDIHRNLSMKKRLADTVIDRVGLSPVVYAADNVQKESRQTIH